jgi:hypothetical protein
VDFVVTPVIGTGWLILEDFLEADLGTNWQTAARI